MLMLAACSVGPDYQRPDAPAPAAFKENQGWKPSNPADAVPRGAWWSVYNDPVLDQLEAQVAVDNQNVRAALAAYAQAKAVIEAGSAGFWPSLSLDPAFKRGTGSLSNTVIRNTYTVPLTISWDADVWGKIRRTVESDQAAAFASEGDLANATLSAQGQLAVDYFQLRAADRQREILRIAVEAYGQSLRIARNQYNAGINSRADVAQAETQLKSTEASLINVGILRGQLEHAMAVLVGKAPAEFAVTPAPLALVVPVVPVDVPSALLERRPDIAAAERRVAAANANIGVAIAAYYPDLSLSASLSYASTNAGDLFKSANRIWSFGPTLSQTLFDGGLRSAQVDEQKAAWEQTVATYRQTVLTAFQQVEDDLNSLKVLEQEADTAAAALAAARQAEQLVLNQYKAGNVAYTSVVTAQTAALNSEQTALTIQQNRLVASVNLIQALGGGWSVAEAAP